MLEYPESVKGFYVYQYTFLDDLSFIKAPEELFQDEEREKLETFIGEIRTKFREAGWEGDGKIGIIWFPPFIDVGVEDTYGTYVWHVKQDNNGISFIASEYPIDFERLNYKNDLFSGGPREGKPINIVHNPVFHLKRVAEQYRTDIVQCLEALDSIPDQEIKNKLNDAYLVNTQGMLVRELQEFLDECYLSFLVEAIDHGNPYRIRIKKSKVSLNPDTYVPDDVDEDGASWFTIKGIVSDMWKAYKFEPFNSKLDMLFKSIDYDYPKATKLELAKHVILRNCIQHHGGQLEPSCLKQCGVEGFTLRGKDGAMELKKWEFIIFTSEELQNFCSHLLSLADNFNAYVDERIPTRHLLHTFDKPEDRK